MDRMEANRRALEMVDAVAPNHPERRAIAGAITAEVQAGDVDAARTELARWVEMFSTKRTVPGADHAGRQIRRNAATANQRRRAGF